jgi:hypothetical protein
MQKAKFKMQMLRPARAGRLGAFAFCILNFALLGASAGCANKAGAATVPDGPPLAMPAPPPRVITPVEIVAEAPPPVTPDPAPAAPPRPPAARPPAARQEPPAPTPPASQPVVTTTTPPAPEPREVRAVPSAAAAAEERKVRDVMTRATRDLNRVDYQKLSVEGKSQYDQSKRFSEQAEQAIKDRNYVYAMTLADKAATLAAELAGR